MAQCGDDFWTVCAPRAPHSRRAARQQNQPDLKLGHCARKQASTQVRMMKTSRTPASAAMTDRQNERGRPLRRPYFLMSEIPSIQPRQMGDFIGSSKAQAFMTVDLGQSSHQGNSKAQSSSPGRHPPTVVLNRHVNGAGTCSIELCGTSDIGHGGQSSSLMRNSQTRPLRPETGQYLLVHALSASDRHHRSGEEGNQFFLTARLREDVGLR